MAVIGFPALLVHAAETPLTKTEIFRSDTAEYSYDFKDEIEENDQRYKLDKVDYTVLSKQEETEIKHKVTTETVDNLYEPSVVSPAKTKAIVIDGKEYTAVLEDIGYEIMTITDRTAEVETTVKLTEDKITDSIQYEYEDIQSKKKVIVTLSKDEVTKTDETEENTITFPVVFHRYDAGVFLINGKLIPLQEEGSPINEQYFGDLKAESAYASASGKITSLEWGDLKAESAYASASGKITSLEWNGAPYTTNGETCRNALATLTESRKVYAVKYSDKVVLPDTEGYRAILTYGTDVEVPTGKISYEVQAKAEYILIEGQDYQPLFIGIGVAVFALAAVLILVIIAKRRKKHRYTTI